MEQRYKLTIFSKNIYKEIELLPDAEQIKIGTAINCDIRLRKDLFFEDFVIALVKNNEAWTIQVSDNVYLDFGGNRKIWSKPITHGDHFSLKYSSSDSELFSGRFYVDFDYENRNYDRIIDISGKQRVTIGTQAGSNIQISSSYVYDDSVELVVSGSQIVIQNIKSQYGVFLNGKKIEGAAELQSYDFFSIADFGFYYRDGKLYTDKAASLQIHGLQFNDTQNEHSTLTYPEYHRNSRIHVKVNEEEIPLLAPKEKPQKPKSNLLLKLLPALSMIVLTVAIRGFMSSTNMSFVLFSVCSMSVGAVVSIFTIINDKKEYEESVVKRDIGYRSYIDKKRNEIKVARKEEVEALDKIYLPFADTSKAVSDFSGDLFDRVADDEDFLDVKIGTGSIEAIRKIGFKQQETYESDEDDLVDLPVQLSENFKNIDAAPVVVHLKQSNVVGVIGSKALQYEMLKIMMFDVCIRQYYHDVSAFLFIPEDQIRRYQWVKWLKHFDNSELNCRNIICDEPSKTSIFEYLYSELNRRESSKEKTFTPHLLIFVMKDYAIDTHPVSKYIDKASDLGCTFIFFEQDKEHIPIGASSLVYIDGDKDGHLVDATDDSKETKFTYSPISDQMIFSLTHRMAPIYCEEVSLEGALTKNITLYQLLGIFSEEDLDLNSRWSRSDVTRSMAAPIGVRSGNEIVYLNIHDNEKAHGPHGLVAGTTGSGKSEVLMTYILSMATLYSPYEVAFLIIDFKGGGMGNQFKTLPHTLGVITDIDGKEINRSLISIKAELERRKKLFAEADVDHINKYIRAWKSKKVTTPLPHLIIIVDEFAELKAQYGDFMAELNSAARVGRSLGVHLILATQKPQGQVDPQIDSNSKFRLCLKVQTPEDSREVIKSPLAAEIREAGRAYLLVGNNEIFELFQSAYSGAPAGIEASTSQKEFSISAVDFAGRRTVVYQRKHQKPAEGEAVITQKDAITQWIVKFFTEHNLPKLPDICQPPLQKLLKYSPSEKIQDVGIYARLGIFDDPAHQRQEDYIVDVSLQHMLIIGSLQTGKTNVLQLLIRDLSEKYSPSEINFYIIDFSSMILSNFQKLNHVGGVVLQNQDEKLNNLFKLLSSEITKRKQQLKSHGVSSYRAYREAGYSDLPLIMLIIDNLTLLKELYLGDNPILLTILREGSSVGISVVVANSATKGIEQRYLSAFSCRIGLYHNNSDEYATLFNAYKLTVEPVPGRCVVTVDKETLDCQITQSFTGEKEYQRSKEIELWVTLVNDRYPNAEAVRIPEIPEYLIQNEIITQYPKFYHHYQIILGFDYDSLQPFTINLSGMNLIVSGTKKSGKGNFIKYLITSLERDSLEHPVKIALFDKATVKKFANVSQECSIIDQYELSPMNLQQICQEWKMELLRRKQLVLQSNGDLSVLDNLPLLMMIFEDSSKDMLSGFDESLFDLFDYKFTWIASNADNDDISPMRAPVLFRAKQHAANCLVFGSVQASNLFDSFAKITVAEKRERLGGEVSVGDACYVSSDDMTKVYRLKTIVHSSGR